MTTIQFTAVIAAGSVVTGILGALTGLGGGFIVVPVLTMAFGIDVRYAVGASLVCVIATSTGSAARFVREGFANVRIGIFLEMATSAGAVFGALLAPRISTAWIGGLFGLLLLHAAWLTLCRENESAIPATQDPVSAWLGMDGTYPSSLGPVPYRMRHAVRGFGVMALAGMLSGLLGIGSGLVKVIAMDQVMGLPFKVAATTSTFMIGVTAAASAGVHLSRGDIDPVLVMPVVIGVLSGTFLGGRLMPATPSRRLRLLFAAVLIAAGLQMIYTSTSGGLG